MKTYRDRFPEAALSKPISPPLSSYLHPYSEWRRQSVRRNLCRLEGERGEGITTMVIYHLSIATGVLCYNIGSRDDLKSDCSFVDQYSRPNSYQNYDNPSQYQYFHGSYPSNGLSQSSGDYYHYTTP
uniref:Uncharacterized protein n=1 Tax=Timema genevievae TaxID=629358 RepID=A0A7R9PNY5_TIMGE|nr:unnamed protein product [Timema genevievae]